MITHDFEKLNRKAFFMALEQERQEWLAQGMSEADIFQMHFGKDGDYSVWLSARKHMRSDHKYCPGTPISIEDADIEGIWIKSNFDEFNKIEIRIDLINAIKSLTQLQRFCFIEIVLKERTQDSVANEIGKSRTNVRYAVNAAKKNLKKFF